MSEFLEGWTNDPQAMKGAFIKLKERMSGKEHVTFTFISRPGVSYSLRGAMDNLGEKGRPLFVMIDIIDDDPENRWLSVWDDWFHQVQQELWRFHEGLHQPDR